jgi:FKBP-type peptidyl-prolyl cis-trans isomerase SlyD
MDFNHDLAGKELHFTGEVTAIRDATEKELTDGLHGERAAQGCTHDCSSCGGGCGN